MCLFKKIKIDGKAYTPDQVREMLAKCSRKISNLEESEKRLGDEVEYLKKETEYLKKENHRLSCANGTLRSENNRLREELGDFPARLVTGRYVKRKRNSAAALAKPEVEPSKQE